jgi:DNA-binding transcriptional regulator YhcF (GntR family)
VKTMTEASRPAPVSRPVSRTVQLADTIERQIADGAYRAGDKLPSLRELAELHRYAKNTVVAEFVIVLCRVIV